MNDFEPSDQELIARALRGEAHAFTPLMRRHKDWLYRFVRRYVRDSEEAYDIVQESFVSAWNALMRYDPSRPFDIWLRRIALNKCRDRARKAIVRQRMFRLFGASPEETEAAPDWVLHADATIAKRAALGRLEEAVRQLPPSIREPLILTQIEGLSHKDAGEILGLNAKAVEMRVYRAKKQLAEMLSLADLEDVAEG